MPRRWTWREKVRVIMVFALADLAEYADMALLPAMYLALSRSLNISATQLGMLSMWRGVTQAICIPFAGVAGDLHNRLHLIAAGTLIWGAMSGGMGCANAFWKAAAWNAATGVGLALVAPCWQSIVAEVFAVQQRGRAFGCLLTISGCGGLVVNFLAISYSNKHVGTLEGWRLMFYAMAGVALFTALIVLIAGIEPRCGASQTTAGDPPLRTGWASAVLEGFSALCKSVTKVFRTPSFVIVLAAGMVGSITFMSTGYRNMYFQLLGFSDSATATISTVFKVGLALGFFIGGAAGDGLARWYPITCRPLINQVAITCAAVLTVLLYRVLPGSSSHATGLPGSLDHFIWQYCVLEFLIGAFGGFPISNNAALFAEIIPVNIRTSVYGFDKSITGAVGAAFTPLAGALAERFFGFVHDSHHTHVSQPGLGNDAAAMQARANVRNAAALEKGLLWMTVVPMVIKVILYSGLYFTLPKDRIPDEVDKEPDSGDGQAQLDLPNVVSKEHAESPSKPDMTATAALEMHKTVLS